MKGLIKRNINGKKVLFLFIITNIVYAFMLMITIPGVMAFSNGMKLLDMMPTGYDHAYVNALFKTLGEKGRETYLFRQLPVDMIYPLLFAVSSCLVLAYFLNKIGKTEGPLFYLCFIPVFSGLFDYGENIGIITMLKTYPENLKLYSQVTNVFSILKSSCTATYFILLIILLIVFVKNRLGRNFQ
jgi:hypothetical protein